MINTSNLCMFEGRVAKDPQFSQINGQNGQLIEKVVFDLAVDRNMTSAQKQQAQQNNNPTADFIHCSMIGNQVNAFKQYCPKGKAVKVVARYSQYTYQDKNTGQTQYGHQFDVDNFGFVTQDSKALSNGNNGRNDNFQQNNFQQPPQNNYQQQPQQQNFMNAPQPQQQSNFSMFSNNPASPF